MPDRRASSAIAALAMTAVAACATPREAPMHVHVPSEVFAGDADAITVSWIGHATLLVGIRGHWFLTDPMFSDRLAGVATRNVKAAMAPSELPPLDAILVSHAHFDHLDFPSLRRLSDVPLLVPPGIPTFLPADLPQHQVVALDAWQTWTRGDVQITAVPTSHGDGRYLVDRWYTRSHTGWVIQVGERTVYFAGDTGYIAAQARALREHFHIDVDLLPGRTRRPRELDRAQARRRPRHPRRRPRAVLRHRRAVDGM